MEIKAFKAYDIRGEYPLEINEDLAYKLGLAFVAEYRAKEIVVGHDIRESSPQLFTQLVAGICDAGADVISLDICGTEEVYFNTVYLEADGGIMITASHNPKSHNGFKLVARDAEPISGSTGLEALKRRILQEDFGHLTLREKGLLRHFVDKRPYLQALLQASSMALPQKGEDFPLNTFTSASSASSVSSTLSTSPISPISPKPLRIVCNSGNGCAGAIVDLLEPYLPYQLIKIHHEPDGTFPNGVPNPLLVERRQATQEAIQASGADFGVAWDGDFDRCFFFDERGDFVDSSYIVGLLATVLLTDHPNSTIVIDTRQTLNSEEAIKNAGGKVVISAGGHSPMKESMRKFNALYGGEMSAHHYFQAFHYCDSGMIPFLLISQLLAKSDQTLGELVAAARRRYPCSGELNYLVIDSDLVMAKIADYFKDRAVSEDYLDGLSLRLDDSRINVRASNTEPYLRINIEGKGSEAIVKERQREIGLLLTPYLQ